jgi:hypothetical protein
MATTPNYGWVMPDPTDFVTSLPADFEIFGDAVDATVDGIETIANAAQPNVITTEGDLVVGDASGDPIRLPIGALGTILTSDGDTAEWGAAPASGSLTLITSTTISNAAAVNFTSIPQDYKHLFVEILNYKPAVDGAFFYWRYNNVTTSTYGSASFIAIGGGSATFNNNQTHMGTQTQFLRQDNTATSTSYGFIKVLDYTNTTTSKMSLHFGISNDETTPATLYRMTNGVGTSLATTAITELNFSAQSGNITSGIINLYGVN